MDGTGKAKRFKNVAGMRNDLLLVVLKHLSRDETIGAAWFVVDKLADTFIQQTEELPDGKPWHNPGPNTRHCHACDRWYLDADVSVEGKASEYEPTVRCPYCGAVQGEAERPGEGRGDERT